MITELDLHRMVHVSMDGPKVNLSFHREAREEQELPKLVDIGSCGLHIIHGAFKTGAESTDWNLEKS